MQLTQHIHNYLMVTGPIATSFSINMHLHVHLRVCFPLPEVIVGFFVGLSCEEIKLCDPNPCLNGGTCIERTGLEYVCECPANFVGSNCSSCQDGFGLADGYCSKSSSYYLMIA